MSRLKTFILRWTKAVLQTIRELSPHLILSLIWALSQTFDHTTIVAFIKQFPFSAFMKEFSLAFIFLSFLINPVSRIKRQQDIDEHQNELTRRIDGLDNQLKLLPTIAAKFEMLAAKDPGLSPVIQDLNNVTLTANAEIKEIRSANAANTAAQRAAIMAWYTPQDVLPAPRRFNPTIFEPASSWAPRPPEPDSDAPKKPEKDEKS